jgi:hypothetical protein
MNGAAAFWGIGASERLRVAAGAPCAGRVVWLELGEELRPPWWPGPPVPFWLAHQPGAPGEGRALAHIVEKGQRHPAIVESEGGAAAGAAALA